MTRTIAKAAPGVVTLLAYGMLSASPALANQPVEVSNANVPQALIANEFNQAIAGLDLHLNNYGSKKGSGQATNWQHDTSFISVPGIGTHSFAIPSPWLSIMPANLNVGGRFYRLYVSDVNSQSVQASAANGLISVRLEFQSQGPELRIKCMRRRIRDGRWVECNGANIDMDELVIEPFLKPVVRQGSISFDNFGAQDIELDYDLGISGHWICNLHNLCDWIADEAKGELTDELKKQVVARLNTNQLKTRVADAVRDSQLIDLVRLQNGLTDPEWQLVDISAAAGNFVLRFERPAAIQEASFGASPVAGACPAPAAQGKQVKLNVAVATYGQQAVRMRYRYPGQGWSSWNQKQAVPAWGGHMAHFDLTPTQKLAPGSHKIDVQVDRYEPILSQNVEVTCPLEITKAELLAFQDGTFNPHSGGPIPMPAKVETECPLGIGLRPIFTHAGTGSFQYRFRFVPDHKLTTPFAASFQYDMGHPLHADPGFYHVFPLPLPPTGDAPPQGIGGFLVQQPAQGGELGLTAGQTPPNEYKGSVRVEATTQFGTVVSDWVPYHIVCKPKSVFESIGGITTPLPDPPPQPLSGLSGQQPLDPPPTPVVVSPPPVSPPRAQPICENGAVRSGECVCEASMRRIETGPDAWRCERPRSEIRPTITVPLIRPPESSERPNATITPPRGIQIVPGRRAN